MEKNRVFKIAYFMGERRDLFVTEFGYSERYRSRRVGPDTRGLYLLHFEVKGHCEFGDFDVHEGDACLLSANLVHAFRIVNESTRYWLCFGGERAGEILSAFGIPADRHARLVIERPQELFSELARFFARAREHRETAAGEKYALSALMSALPRLSVAEDSVHSSADDYISRALRYMKRNCHRSLRMEEIAARLCLSEKYFGRLFKEKMGTSPKAYFQMLRIEKAKKLLSEGQSMVAEVAAATGFASATRFSQAFSRALGISPSAYRERKGKMEN